jgi:hypothetical protein
MWKIAIVPRVVSVDFVGIKKLNSSCQTVILVEQEMMCETLSTYSAETENSNEQSKVRFFLFCI